MVVKLVIYIQLVVKITVEMQPTLSNHYDVTAEYPLASSKPEGLNQKDKCWNQMRENGPSHFKCFFFSIVIFSIIQHWTHS